MSARKAPGQRAQLTGVSLNGDPTLEAMSVRAGDVLPLLAVLSGDASLASRLGWQDGALCPETDPELFFIEAGSSTAAARSVCHACPVRRPCLADALANMGDLGYGRMGVWGGTSPEQRLYLRRRFGTDAGAALDFAMRQDCRVPAPDMQPRKAAA